MKKTEFIDAIAAKGEMTKAEARRFLDIVEEVTLEAIASNDAVPFAFAKIGGKDVAARKAHNPRTGETINVPAKTGYPYAKFTKAAKEQ